MKFTRIYILKLMDEDAFDFNNDSPVASLKKLTITNNNIDMMIIFILSLLFFITKSSVDESFYKVYPINFISIININIVVSIIYLIVEICRITINTWEQYLRGLKKPVNSSERSSLQSNNSKNNERTSINNQKTKIEMENLDEKKNPLIQKEESKEVIKENINNNEEIFSLPNLNNDANLSCSDKIFSNIYNFHIKAINYLINNYANNYLLDKNKKKISIFQLITKYPHTINSIFHLLKFILFLLSFGLSFSFWIIYSSLEKSLKKYYFNSCNLFVGELVELYCIFRILFFSIKIIYNIILAPIYFSAIYLGYIEDQYNEKLNDLINTRTYTNKKCLISRDSINKIDQSEIDDTCAICLCSYIKGDIISTLPCSKRHSFHTFCLEEWFHNNLCCPLCRCDFAEQIGSLLPEGGRRSDNLLNLNNIVEQNNVFQQENNVGEDINNINNNNIQNNNQGNEQNNIQVNEQNINQVNEQNNEQNVNNIQNNNNNRVNVEMMDLNNNVRNNNH